MKKDALVGIKFETKIVARTECRQAKEIIKIGSVKKIIWHKSFLESEDF